MRFWLLPFYVSCKMLCPYKLLLLLLWFAAVRVVDTGVLGGLVAGGAGRVGEIAAACHVGSMLARLPRALLRMELLCARS